MKLLLCVNSLQDIDVASQHFAITPQTHPQLKYIYIFKVLHHEVDVVETGYGSFQTMYKTTKALSLQKYHLALKLSKSNAYKREIALGTILNIVNEKPGDHGTFDDRTWKDLYDLGLLKMEDEPQQRGGFVNLTNAYMNVFMPFKKVVSVTVDHFADASAIALRKEKYRADCETMDGFGFVYTCLYEKQSFYQLAVIEKNLETGEENKDLAKDKMNEALIGLIEKL